MENTSPQQHSKSGYLSTKLWQVTVLIIAALLLLGYIGTSSLNKVFGLTNKLYEHPFIVSNSVRDVQYRMTAMHLTMSNIVVLKNKDEVQRNIQLIRQHDMQIKLSFKQINQRFLGDNSSVEVAENAYLQWQSIRQQIIKLVEAGSNAQAAHLSQSQSEQQIKVIEKHIAFLLDFANAKAQSFLHNANQQHQQALYFYWSATAALTVFVLLMAWISYLTIVPPINRMSKAVRLLARGDLNIQLTDKVSNTEIGAIEEDLILLKESSQLLSAQANKIAQGEYQFEIEPRSENDVIGLSMSSMLNSLKLTAYQNQGMSGLNEVMRGEQSLEQLATHILHFLCLHTKSELGCIYVQKNKTIYSLGQYAIAQSEHVAKTIQLGEGLVGEAALQKKTLTFTNQSDHYFKIESAIGSSELKTICIVPILWDEEVLVLIEFGRLEAMQEKHRQFLDAASLPIAAIVHTALNQDSEILTWE